MLLIMSTLILLYLSLLSSVTTEPTSVTIHVNSDALDKSCSISEDTHCSTIEAAYNLLQGRSYATILIESNVTLSQELHFINVSNIAISGPVVHLEGYLPVIECTGPAGIYVENASTIHLSNLILTQCMFNSSDYLSAITFTTSSDIDIAHVAILRSHASGLTLLNCHGDITLTAVNFTQNGKIENSCNHKSGALNIEIMEDNLQKGAYNIRYCVFQDNLNKGRHECIYIESSSKVHWAVSRLGGGMRVILGGNGSSGHSINLDYCKFVSNVAKYGGGIYTQFQDNCEGNKIYLNNTIFYKNTANESGGGFNMNFITDRSIIKTNVVHVENSVFLGNTARYGGGLIITSTFSDVQYKPGENIYFQNCRWDSNIGKAVSPAVDIAPYVHSNSERHGYLPVPQFQDIQISNNVAGYKKHMGLIDTRHINSGVFLITESTVHFSGHVTFTSNFPSAMQAVSGVIVLDANTIIEFHNNSGINGGAIALYGFSHIYLMESINLIFQNNTVSGYGGAIYYHGIDQRDFLTGLSCFIEIKDYEKNNITFVFEGNEAQAGKWIYAETYYTCIQRLHLSNVHPLSWDNITACFGMGTQEKEHRAIMSSAQHFTLQKLNSSYAVIPGEPFKVSFELIDELNEIVTPLLSFTTHSPIFFKPPYTINGNMLAVGQPNSKAKVTVTVLGLRSIFFEFDLETLFCPPGYVFNKNVCVCGNEPPQGYNQILSCNAFRAYMKQQYWVGYIPEISKEYTNLYFAPCLAPICNSLTSQLPRNISDLNEIICGPIRTGIMCGKCKNTTVFFHSNTYSCRDHGYCHFGPLLYILSELFPLTVFFLVVIVFDMTFTSGSIVGFIFFSQYFEQLIQPADYAILKFVQVPYKLYYGIFNLEYFNVEVLSYCLWKNLNIQDIIVFKYVTVIFSFALVMMLIALLRSGRCTTICNFRSQISKKYSYVHGLSAFLAICYIQCTKTSFLILRYARPEGLNGTYHQRYTYYGGLKYFQGIHLIYGILAIFSLITVTILPVIVLLLHPLLLQLLSVCKLSEHWLVLNLLQFLRFQYLIPFLDCFQSCYKDRYRFFSGLYYVYRIALLMCFTTAESFSVLVLYVQILLSLFLGVHALVHPYKKQLHNKLDSLVFLNLCLINVFNIVNNTYIKAANLLGYELNDNSSVYLQVTQTFLLYLPMLVSMCWIFGELFQHCRSKILETTENNDILQEDHILDNEDRDELSSRSSDGRDNCELNDCSN